MPDNLWCCHVRGSDDVYPAPDYATALKWVDITNALNWRGPKRSIEPPQAVPALWPGTAETHAEFLPLSIREFTPRNELPPDNPDYRGPEKTGAR